MRRLSAIILAASLASCVSRGPPATPSPRPPPSTASSQPSPGASATPGAERPPAGAARQFHLSTATSALVAQAHTQAAGGDFVQAAATLERALRIEPENPLLWLELGRVRLGENNAAQASAMGRKALALATGDPGTEAAAWRLIADSLRAQGRNPEAAAADEHAAAAAAH
jgi:Flp pilus assembly protein TadD